MKDGIIYKFSAGGVVVDDAKFLLIYWKSENSFELPKGTIEDGETPEMTCIREIKEETGYDAEIISPLDTATYTFVWKDGKTYTKTVHNFLTRRINDKEPQPNREENEDFENYWLTFDEAIEKATYDDVKETLRKAKAYLMRKN